MAFKVFPTSVAGVQLPFNQLKGPLSKLWNKDTFPNYYFPQDIGNNPAHCHVVQISIFEYTTDFEQNTSGAVSRVIDQIQNSDLPQALKDKIATGQSLTDIDIKDVEKAGIKGLDALGTVYSAKTYKTRPGGESLANISLYMPDSLSVDYNATYSDVSLSQAVGTGGLFASALSEMGGAGSLLGGKAPVDLLKQFTNTSAGKQLGLAAAKGIANKIGLGGLGQVAGQVFHQIINPQLQLVYQGIGFREFQLDFIFTPKSSYEAETAKNIIDTLVYYSSPGIAGQNTENQQQYLVPPQLFKIKFLFTGKNEVLGSLGSVFNKAFTNIGLDFLTGEQNKLSINADQNINTKLFNIGDCVLTDVSVDYAPNGWAAFDDGHPVQTKLSLKFKEINIVTKERLKKEGKYGAAYTPDKFKGMGY